jgi:hypothetical protein
MSMKRKLLRLLMLVIMGGASFMGARMNPKEIEDVLHIMNETKVEFSIPDKDLNGDGNQPQVGIDSSKRAPVRPKS